MTARRTDALISRVGLVFHSRTIVCLRSPLTFSTLPFARGLEGVTGNTFEPCLRCQALACSPVKQPALSEIHSRGVPKVSTIRVINGIVLLNVMSGVTSASTQPVAYSTATRIGTLPTVVKSMAQRVNGVGGAIVFKSGKAGSGFFMS